MIRLAQPADIDTVVAIYNQAIDAGFQTAFTEKFTVPDRAEWFQQHVGSCYPLFVCEQEGRVVGWLSVSPYRMGRGALRFTVEVSYFVDKDHQKMGIGSALMDHALAECRRLGYKTALAIILEKNTASTRLMEKFGFHRWAYLPDVADFDGEPCAHVYYGRRLG